MGHEVIAGYSRDTLGFVRVLRDGGRAGLEDIEAARTIFLELGDVAAAAWPTMHIGTYHRRHGRAESATSAYREAVRMTAGQRDRLAAYNARVNLEFTLGSRATMRPRPGFCGSSTVQPSCRFSSFDSKLRSSAVASI